MGLWLMLSSPATHSRTADTAITASAPCVCLICVCSFCDNKREEGKQTGFSFFVLFFLSLSLNSWTKVRESKDTRREREQTDTGDCQADCDKTFTGKLSPCHKALLFWIPKGFEFSNKLWKVDQFRAPPNDSGLQCGSHLWTAALEVVWSRDFNLCISA